MNRAPKKIILIVCAVLFLVLLAAFQIAFINPSSIELNIFLVLAIYLVLTKNNSKALIFAWLGGLLTSSGSILNFGINSLILLIVTAILIILYKTVFLTLKTETILFMSVISIVLYHLLNWSISFESFSSYFSGQKILIELVLTSLLMLAIFKFKNKAQNVQKII